MPPVTLVMIARVPPPGIAAFQDYETAVLPLLAAHGGSLQRRLRSKDGGTEVHVVRFATRAGLDAYRADPGRAAAGPLLASSGARIEVMELADVD